MSENLRIAVGMATEEFNSQPLVARQSHALDSKDADVFTLREAHRVELVVNGRTIVLNSGAPRAPTYVTSGFYVHDSLEGRDRIRAVDFDTTAEPVPLSRAVALAEPICKSVREAALTPRHEGAIFATISEAAGRAPKPSIANKTELFDAFLGPIRARSVVLCELEDDAHTFAISITSLSRVREQQLGGSDDFSASEDTYTVNIHFAQNLDRAIEKAERLAGKF